MQVYLGVIIFCCSLLATAETQPYAGHQNRPIKALSPQQVQDYLQGKGMGLAKPAELSGYPGPAHVLDLSEKLELSDEQLQQTQRLYEQMLRDAKRLGEEIVTLEKQLDYLFVSGAIEETQLSDIVHKIGKLQTQLRLVHLAAHLKQKALLTPHQVHTYNRLRGYTSHNH
ncbi:LTXXQ motif family protein [Alteromonadaceae bacterium 2753L.S.0a.02]|nr:LTXXQ motif family protein [Alteromonadaceae bacterium 2753L.S.0a.02]